MARLFREHQNGWTPLSRAPSDHPVVATRQEPAAASDGLTYRLGKAGAPHFCVDASATTSPCIHGRWRQAVPRSTLRRFRAT